MKHAPVVAAAAAALLLTGCTAPDGATAPGSVAGPAPTLAADQAARTYLQLSAASNAARESWARAPEPTAATLDTHRKLATRAAGATDAFAAGLRGHRWPDPARARVDALVAHLGDRAAAYRRAAAADTLEAYRAAAAQVPVTDSLTGDVRRALGLPESPAVPGAPPR